MYLTPRGYHFAQNEHSTEDANIARDSHVSVSFQIEWASSNPCLRRFIFSVISFTFPFSCPGDASTRVGWLTSILHQNFGAKKLFFLPRNISPHTVWVCFVSSTSRLVGYRNILDDDCVTPYASQNPQFGSALNHSSKKQPWKLSADESLMVWRYLKRIFEQVSTTKVLSPKSIRPIPRMIDLLASLFSLRSDITVFSTEEWHHCNGNVILRNGKSFLEPTEN